MKPVRLLVALLLMHTALAASAAPATYLTLDHSTDTLMSAAAAQELWSKTMPSKLSKLYPVRKWGFLSQVEGGFDDNKLCIITARATLLPREGKLLLFKPEKTATTYGSRSNATAEQCQALASAKLAEAIEALRFSILGN